MQHTEGESLESVDEEAEGVVPEKDFRGIHGEVYRLFLLLVELPHCELRAVAEAPVCFALQVRLVQPRQGFFHVGRDVSVPVDIPHISQHVPKWLGVLVLVVLVKPKLLHELGEDHPRKYIGIWIGFESSNQGKSG